MTNDGIKAPGWMYVPLASIIICPAAFFAFWIIINFISDANEGWWR